MKLKEVFGAVLRRQREQAGVTQEDLADKVGLHRNYIGMLERGKRTPTIDAVHRLAIGLNTTMSALLKEVEQALSETPP